MAANHVLDCRLLVTQRRGGGKETRPVLTATAPPETPRDCRRSNFPVKFVIH